MVGPDTLGYTWLVIVTRVSEKSVHVTSYLVVTRFVTSFKFYCRYVSMTIPFIVSSSFSNDALN